MKRRACVLAKIFAQFLSARELLTGKVLALDVRSYRGLTHNLLTDEKPFRQPVNIVLFDHIVGHNPGWVSWIRAVQRHLAPRMRLHMLKIERAPGPARNTFCALLNARAHDKEILEVGRQVRLRPSTKSTSLNEVRRDGTAACDGILKGGPCFPVQLLELVIAVRARLHLVNKRHFKVVLKVSAHARKVSMNLNVMPLQQSGMTDSRKHQELGRVDGPRRNDDFFIREGLLLLTANGIFNADGPLLIHQNFEDLRPDQHSEVSALLRRPQIRTRRTCAQTILDSDLI